MFFLIQNLQIYRECALWCFTRDVKLRKLISPSNLRFRYGLWFQVNHCNSHALICLLLAGDISVNPGPTCTSTQYQPQKQFLEDYAATCLVINARSLKSLHKLNGKQVCNLARFQELVYAEAADLVWVTETWLTKAPFTRARVDYQPGLACQPGSTRLRINLY